MSRRPAAVAALGMMLALLAGTALAQDGAAPKPTPRPATPVTTLLPEAVAEAAPETAAAASSVAQELPASDAPDASQAALPDTTPVPAPRPAGLALRRAAAQGPTANPSPDMLDSAGDRASALAEAQLDAPAAGTDAVLSAESLPVSPVAPTDTGLDAVTDTAPNSAPGETQSADPATGGAAGTATESDPSTDPLSTASTGPRPEQRPDGVFASPRPARGLEADGPLAGSLNPPRPRRRLPPSCTRDGAHCIAPIRFVPDVCTVIEDVSAEAGLDPHFLARLLWRESLFDPYAISPAGALGIAQFMPGTAELRGLDDPFNPAEAMRASADYLADLRSKFGNLGLAAAAYNGGEARVARYLDGDGGLPMETRAYVYAITGHRVDTWRETPPALIDLSFDPDKPFREACIRHASARAVPAYRPDGTLMPWAMIFTAHRSRDLAERRGRWLHQRHADLIGDMEMVVGPSKLPGRSVPVYTAQIGQTSRQAAHDLCNMLRVAGTGCMVLRN